MQPKYKVPIIPQNLRREETIIQIAEALNYLSDVSNDIFKRVNERIKSNNDQITDINSRIKTANLKLNKLSGDKKATKVFSSSKYPATDINRQYISIFNDEEVLPVEKFSYKYKNTHIKDDSLDTLQFYHVKVREKNIKENNDGLGELPKDVETVNDLLLYNSGKNPYNSYIISDTLNISQNLKKEDVKNISDIGAAPLSISERTGLPRNVGESYFYAPDLGNVPSINVPLDLPDLPGIADDLRYVIETGPGIAPSVTTTPSNPALPSLPQDELIFTEVTQPKPLPISNIEKPPADEVVVENKEIIEEEDQAILPDNVKDANVVDINISDDKIENKVKVPQVNDVRASLMEAIRKAGGKNKLKPAESTEAKKTAPTGDLIADLHAKLLMRRKGISGNKPENLDSKSAMDKVSAMIPPPPIQTDVSESTEDEWED